MRTREFLLQICVLETKLSAMKMASHVIIKFVGFSTFSNEFYLKGSKIVVDGLNSV